MDFHRIFPTHIEQFGIVILFFFVIVLLLLIAEWLSRSTKIAPEFSRKFIHVGVGLSLIGLISFTKEAQPILFIALLFIAINFIIKQFHLLPSLGDQRDSYGTIYFPLSVFFLCLFLWDSEKDVLIITILIMSVSDALAAIVGEKIENPHAVKLLTDIKSFEGSLVFFISTFVIILLAALLRERMFGTTSSIMIAFIIASAVTVCELISYKGSDNITVPLLVVFLLIIFKGQNTFIQTQLMVANIFGIAFGVLATTTKLLKPDGALAAYFLAFFIYGFGGWIWTVPILLFFFTSSLLSKAGQKYKRRLDDMFEKSSTRDAHQVFANGLTGLIGSIVYYFYPSNLVLMLYIVTLATANADTWATEIGVYSKSMPRLITTLKTVPKGTSGAISLYGTVASFCGSALIASLIFWSDLNFNFHGFLILTLSGFLATLLDSFLGATVQAQYKTPDSDRKTEKRFSLDRVPNQLIHGYSWFNNDLVNLASIWSSVLIFLILRHYLKC